MLENIVGMFIFVIGSLFSAIASVFESMTTSTVFLVIMFFVGAMHVDGLTKRIASLEDEISELKHPKPYRDEYSIGDL